MAAFTTINDAGSFFNTVLYTGTGGVQTITGVGFQPDFTWIKDRDVAKWHCLVDTIRGYSKYIYSNSNVAEATFTDRLTSWNSDGFVLGAGVETNTSSSDLVAWNWIGGTTTGIAGSPDITPNSYTFNQTSGFSIINFTGTGSTGDTVPHGLGVVPKMLILKETITGEYWAVYHEAMGATKYLYLNDNAAPITATNAWNDQAPTSTLFYVGSAGETNSSGGNYMAYCFAEVQGFSKFGSYVGNGNADGTFVYTGFRPNFVMLKKYSSTESWPISDPKRQVYNGQGAVLKANLGDAEVVNDGWTNVSLLSNGFKQRGTDSLQNGSGASYLYMAFAESPFVNAEGVPTNAR